MVFDFQGLLLCSVFLSAFFFGGVFVTTIHTSQVGNQKMIQEHNIDECRQEETAHKKHKQDDPQSAVLKDSLLCQR